MVTKMTNKVGLKYKNRHFGPIVSWLLIKCVLAGIMSCDFVFRMSCADLRRPVNVGFVIVEILGHTSLL